MSDYTNTGYREYLEWFANKSAKYDYGFIHSPEYGWKIIQYCDHKLVMGIGKTPVEAIQNAIANENEMLNDSNSTPAVSTDVPSQNSSSSTPTERKD